MQKDLKDPFMHPPVYLHRYLSAAVLALFAGPALAAPLGNVRSVSAGQADGPSWDLVSDSGARVRVSLPRADVVRIQAGPKELVGPGDKAAPIVVASPSKDVQHAFFLPNFRVKQDLVPGMSTSVTFTPTIPQNALEPGRVPLRAAAADAAASSMLSPRWAAA